MLRPNAYEEMGMLENHRYYGLLRMELRKRWLLVCGLIFAIGPMPVLIGFVGAEIGKVTALAFVAATIIVWSLWLGPQERRREQGLIYTLPIGRGRLLGIKLGSLLLLWLPLAAWYWMCAMGARHDADYANSCPKIDDMLPWPTLMFSVPLALLAAITALHMRSPITTCALTAAFGAGLLFPLAINCLIPDPDQVRLEQTLAFGWHCAIAAALLLAWLIYLFTRTRVQELGSGRRTWLALVWIVAFYELLFVLLFTGWRDFWVLVFGF